MNYRIFLAVSLLLASASAVLAHSFTQGPIEIGHPWARPTTTREGAAYLVLATKGTETDRLVGAETPMADRVEIHNAAGGARQFIEIVPKRPFALRPGKAALALIGLKQPLVIGMSFPMTLRFAAAGTVEITVLVEASPGE